MPETVHEGWMVIYGRRMIGLSYIYMRYFVLETRILAYYKKKPQDKMVPIKCLEIDGNCRVEDRGLKMHDGHVIYVLRVYNRKVKKHSITMAAYNIQEALIWKEKIECVIDQHQEMAIAGEIKEDNNNNSSSDQESMYSAEEEYEEEEETIIKNGQWPQSNRPLDESMKMNEMQKNFIEFSRRELEEATDNFDKSCMIGEGGFAFVYKGILRDTLVAIKMPKPDRCQGDEFYQELEILSKVRHPNLISLIGANSESHALVFEFLLNSSLDTFLAKGENSTRKLSWQDRIRIASEICSALIFLHSVGQHGIAHGDLKPANILLDSNLVSKITDFGTSRKLQQVKTTITALHRTNDLKGTIAYFDPVYLSTGELTRQSDVFAFGIILLQLVTDRNPEGIHRIVEHALDNHMFDTIVYGLPGEWPIQEAKKLATLGLLCSDPERAKRPDLEKYVLPSIEYMKRRVAGFIQ